MASFGGFTIEAHDWNGEDLGLFFNLELRTAGLCVIEEALGQEKSASDLLIGNYF